jgi:hypothetical protein
VLIGSAIGALCNPPLIQHRGYAVMSTAAVAVAAVAAPHCTAPAEVPPARPGPRTTDYF